MAYAVIDSQRAAGSIKFSGQSVVRYKRDGAQSSDKTCQNCVSTEPKVLAVAYGVLLNFEAFYSPITSLSVITVGKDTVCSLRPARSCLLRTSESSVGVIEFIALINSSS